MKNLHTSVLCLALLSCLCGGVALAHPSDAEKIDILTRRIEAEPQDPRLYLKRGTVYSEDGHYDLALEDFRRAESLSDAVAVAFDIGVLRARQGDLPAAKSSLDLFLARFPNHSRALEQRARVLAELGDTNGAIENFERLFAVTASPNPGSYTSAARILAAKGDVQNTDRALAMLDKGIERLGMIPQLQEVAIELELGAGRKARALERLDLLAPTLGSGPEWKVDKGELLLAMNRGKEARVLLQSASTQLASLRQTPARRDLAQRISKLQKAFDTTATAVTKAAPDSR